MKLGITCASASSSYMLLMADPVERDSLTFRRSWFFAQEAPRSGIQISIPQPPDTIRELPWMLRMTG